MVMLSCTSSRKRRKYWHQGLSFRLRFVWNKRTNVWRQTPLFDARESRKTSPVYFLAKSFETCPHNGSGCALFVHLCSRFKPVFLKSSWRCQNYFLSRKLFISDGLEAKYEFRSARLYLIQGFRNVAWTQIGFCFFRVQVVQTSDKLSNRGTSEMNCLFSLRFVWINRGLWYLWTFHSGNYSTVNIVPAASLERISHKVPMFPRFFWCTVVCQVIDFYFVK